MTAALVFVLCASSPLDCEPKEPCPKALTWISPSEGYDAVMQTFKDDLVNAADLPDRRKAAKETMEKSLSQLLEGANAFQDKTIAQSDLIALAGASLRLKRYEQATHFARRAATGDVTFDAYVMLVKCLCAQSQPHDALRVCKECSSRFAEHERLYLLFNLVAFEFGRLHYHEGAYECMTTTIDLVSRQVQQHDFYVGHLDRCFTELNIHATHLKEPKRCIERVARVREALWCSLETTINTAARDAAGLLAGPPSLLGECGRICQGVMVCDAHMLPVVNQSGADKWLQLLSEVSLTRENEANWCHEVESALAAVPATLAPQVTVLGLRERLELLSERIGHLDHEGDKKAVVTRMMRKMDGVRRGVEQHERCTSLVGQQLCETLFNGNITDGNTTLRVVHICNPFAEGFQPALRSAQKALTKYTNVHTVYAMVQCGAAYDVRAKRVYKALLSIEEERANASEIFSAIGGPKEVTVLPSDSDDITKLKPEYFPLNILLDAKCRVVGIVGGPERDKMDRLLKLREDAKLKE